jgi:predicted CXXCH cytochrome family protein
MMRKYSLLMIMMLASTVVIYTLTAQNAAARVQGGLHDLSISGSSPFASGNTEEVCVFCHTPHGATMTQSYSTNPNTVGGAGSSPGFLWNRAMPVRAWTPYTSATLQANTAGGPGNLSLLCLSCHDGIGAMNVLTRNPSTGAPDQVSAFNQFGDFPGDPNISKLNIGDGICIGDDCASGGGNLQNDHPIGFSYDAVQPLDSGLQPIGSIPADIMNRLNLTATHSVECSTCHDPHLDNFGGTNFLVLSNNNSALCLGCHIK